MEDILKQILEKLESLEQGQQEIRADIADLKAGQAKLEAGQAKLEAGQRKLEQGQREIRKELKFIWEDIKKIDNRLTIQEQETLKLKGLK
jgi:uncharacterized phage infection (PIP) family protein YhgE